MAQPRAPQDHNGRTLWKLWLAGRLGKAKAITATARKLALIIYCMLRDRTPYREQPAAVYDERHRKRVLHGLRKRAQSLGFDLVQTETGLILE